LEVVEVLPNENTGTTEWDAIIATAASFRFNDLGRRLDVDAVDMFC
jgi:hypothetical protein